MAIAIVDTSMPGSAVVRLLAAAAIVALGAAVGLAEVWRAVHETWSTRYGPYEHGYLVLAMAVWVAVVEWRRAPVYRFSPSFIALVPLAFAVGTLAIMQLLFINSTRLILIPLIVIGAIWTVFGASAARRLIFGVLFLYFALPQWWVINGALQELTVHAVSTILRWTAVPAHIDGNAVLLPSGAFEIASGCSGLNYLMAGTALTGFFALTQLNTWSNRVLLMAIGAIAAILFNWLRVFVVILIGYLSEMQHYLIRVEHDSLGWAMFLGVFAPIVLYGLRLARRERGAHAARIVAGALPVNPACSVPGTVVVASVLAALVLLMPLLPALANSDGKSREVSRLPDDTGGYFRISAPEPAWLPTIPGAQAEFAMYESGGVRIAVYRGGFPSQDVNERLIGGGSSFVGDAYGTSAANVRSIAAPEGKFDVTEYRGRDERGDLVILTWFEIGDYRAHSRFVAKLLELPARLAGRSDAWYLAVSSACAESCDATAQVLDRFLVEAAVDIRAQFTVLPLLVE